MVSLFPWFEPNRKYMGAIKNKLEGRSFANVEALDKGSVSIGNIWQLAIDCDKQIAWGTELILES